jgi:hypothetical protein
MTTFADLKTAYETLLAGHAPVASGGQANDAYEVYVFTLVLEAARSEGATVEFRATSGTLNPSPLTFRTSPGSIFSASNDYSFAALEFPDGLSYEAHIGIYVEGVAGVLHECDVAVIDAAEGVFCRRNKVHPKRKCLALSAECKFYTGKLGISIGREFIGSTTELGTVGRFLLSNSDGKSVDRVLAHHDRDRYFNLAPNNSDAQAQTVSRFRRIFANLRSKKR